MPTPHRPLPVIDIATERLKLVAPTIDDAPDIARFVGDRDVAIRLASVPHPYGLEDAIHFILRIMPVHSVWAVRRKSDGRFIGVIGLAPTDRPDADAELGYWYGKPFWGAGYATEAARGLLGYVDSAGLSRLEAGYFEFNPASGRVLEKVGFRETGRSRRGNLVFQGERPHVDMRRVAVPPSP